MNVSIAFYSTQSSAREVVENFPTASGKQCKNKSQIPIDKDDSVYIRASDVGNIVAQGCFQGRTPLESIIFDYVYRRNPSLRHADDAYEEEFLSSPGHYDFPFSTVESFFVENLGIMEAICMQDHQITMTNSNNKVSKHDETIHQDIHILSSPSHALALCLYRLQVFSIISQYLELLLLLFLVRIVIMDNLDLCKSNSTK